MTSKRWFAIAAVALFASVLWVAAQSQDTAKDPVCGMSVTKAGAKWTFDYKGTTYYFCSEGCKTAFAQSPEKYLAPAPEKKPMGGMMPGRMGQGMMHGQMAQAGDMAKDPVCGMSVAKAGAKWTYEYKGTTYYFCNEGCKTSFMKDPEKYLAAGAEMKPMGGMMHGQMGQGGMMGGCPMMMPDVERKVEITKDGAVITLTSKNPETIKKIQEHATMVKEGKCPMMEMKKDAGAAPGGQAEMAGCAGGCCAVKK
jgi:YHS domain-containing protein